MGRFGTKADNLRNLTQGLKLAKVLPSYVFTLSDWSQDREQVRKELSKLPWSQSPLIVRSSNMEEDRFEQSCAGQFDSVLHVTLEAFEAAVATVLQSYGDTAPESQVLVQPMLTQVEAAGVAMTREPTTQAPYLVISYDDSTGRTDGVTQGDLQSQKTFVFAKCGQDLPKDPLWLGPLIEELRNLEDHFELDHLNVEFGVSNGELTIFQVRPMVLGSDSPPPLGEQQAQTLERLAHEFDRKAQPHPYLKGDTTLFGVMPDWNPAEIIGVRPRPLALSLYQEIITDAIWAYQRDNYGYRNLRSFPLIHSFEGLPYVDVRVSFNSFIPDSVSESLADKLVNFYLAELKEKPAFHDKVEFEIIQSCYSFDFDERAERFRKAGFTQDEVEELRKSLLDLTNRIVSPSQGLWKKDLEKLEELKRRQEILLHSDLQEPEKVYWILEDCKRYGTLPFAGLARAGFVAIQMLRSLVKMGLMNQEDLDQFHQSLHTVSRDIQEDRRDLDRETFLKRYGHLRPGTYDILSLRYDEAFEHYFPKSTGAPPEKVEFSLSMEKMVRIEGLLRDLGLEHTVISLFQFFRTAIEGRERAKFLFTKSVSEALKGVERIGKEHGYDREACSFFNIKDLMQAHSTAKSLDEVFRTSISRGRQEFQRAKQVVLPALIQGPGDFVSFFQSESSPNFVTNRSITGRVITDLSRPEEFEGNIVLIPSADPGFDWIFTHSVGALVTMYGGTNSHMAVRASELNIPAVIGSGEALFESWSRHQSLRIDCDQKKVELVH